ncbi:MAG: methyl-accepting chemotaxis protein [Calditrichaeota bacterium]|nr:MAG: methyl-accepting chemotaxis protein [Calditrichota bacterium]
MRHNFIGLQWKFFFILLSLSTFAIAILVYWDSQNEEEELLTQARVQLEQIGRLLSSNIDGNAIERAVEKNSTQSVEHRVISTQIEMIHRIFANPSSRLPIKSISILIPQVDVANVFYTTQKTYTFLEKYPYYDEFSSVIEKQLVVYKPAYMEANEELYSVFAPIYNRKQEIVAIGKVDISSETIHAALPSTWLRFGAYLLIAVALCFGISYVLSKMVTRPIDRYVDFVNKVSEGNYHLRLEMHTQDELEKIGNALNVMLEKLEGLIETEADRDRLQQNITHLLRIVSAAADGDFTVSAEVTADTLGALADSFNLMVADLSRLIREVQSASDKIAKSTREILETTETMSKGAETQAKEIEGTYDAVRKMADIFQLANERTSQAAESARRAAEVAQGGMEVVKKSIEGMHLIRERVQETARRVRALGERSVEIGEIIEVISDIANRTNLLALNATIEAARAGEAGRGFAVVADEVRVLAERSSQAAKDIAALIETIQAGTSEAVMAMEHGTDEVEKGTRYVDEAGTALKQIIEMVQISSNSITEISGAFQQQTKASSNIAEAMKRTAIIAQETARGARKSHALAEEMETLSRILNTAVSKFRLSKVSSNNKILEEH